VSAPAHPGIAPPLSAGRLIAMLAVLLAAALAVAGGCSLVGITPLSQLDAQIWAIRLVRLLVGALVGAALGAAGTALQGILRNPLADPFILGISSGAGVGVLMGMAVSSWQRGLPTVLSIPAMGLIGAAVTCAVVYGIAQRRGRLDPYVLLLSGVIVNAFNGAIMLAIFLFIKPYVVSAYVIWTMGRLTDNVSWQALVLSSVCVAGGWSLLIFRGSAFNTLGLGDEVASSSGVAVNRLRIETFVVVSLVTAAAVALAGPIGFVGLIVPHICRFIVGPDHRRLMLVSGFIGAMFLMSADTLCRTAGEWVGMGEIPVGIVTAFCGGPFFIFLLRRRGREGWS